MAKGTSPALKVGETIRIDGHRYNVAAIHPSGLAFGYVRPEGKGAGDTKYRYGSGVVAEVRHDPELGFYLPNRITPKAMDVVKAAVEKGTLTEAQGQQVLAFWRNHPQYADRDDLALHATEQAFNIVLWKE